MNVKYLAIVSFILSSCATSYGQKSFWNDGGFTETELQPGVFNVRFVGNEFTSKDRAQDFALLRATELCLSRDMQYMAMGDVNTDSVQSGYTPGSSTTTASAYGYGNSAYGSSTTTYNPGTTVYSPQSGLTVVCQPEKKEGSWDAAFLKRSLKSKYNIVEK
jgi:hypothetical protein